jgi:DNA-binding MarR family transcriptional regulator
MGYRDQSNMSLKRVSIDLSTFVPYFIASIANKNTAKVSQLYLKHFGVGIVQWQIMVVLAIDGKATAQNVANIVGIDKSAVSRAMKKLIEQKLIIPIKGTFPGRSKPYQFSQNGWKLYFKIEEVALKREKTMLASFSDEEKSTLLDFLHRIQDNITNSNADS